MPFDDIVASLVQMAEDSVVSSTPVEITVVGDLGEVAADVATPLAVTLAELLQNAVEHAFGGDGPDAHDGADRFDSAGARGGANCASVGHVVITLAADAHHLSVEVRDDGHGLPDGFDIRLTSSLGLSIVRDLVDSQLGGSIDMVTRPPAAGGGTSAVIEIPLAPTPA